MKKIYALALSVVSCASMFATQVKVGDDLQAALDTAKAGDTLYVQEGTYVGNFIMRDGVNVSGGWSADFSTQKQYGTVLDGDAKGRVLTQTADFSQLTVYDNLTIQNGCLQENGKGAGVYLLWKSRLTNCLVQNNTFAESVTNCEGGGMAQDKDDNAGDIVADNCVFRNNKATHGGGVWLRSTITNCVIENNETLLKHPAGGAHLQWGRMYNCIIRNNHSTEDAGGVRAYGNCKLVNCLIAGNTCDVKVAGLCLERTLSEVINCTIVDNAQTLASTDQEYCGVRCDASSAGSNVFANNVIWGNKAGKEVWKQQISYNITKYGTCVGNAIQGSVPGEVQYIQLGENMADNGPHFVNPAEGNYALQMSSPLLDKGVTQDNGKYVVLKDLAGKARVQGLSVEPGAYELATVNVRANAEDAAAAGKALQDAVDAAAAGTVVFVEAGTYQGNFTMREGVIVSGGWNSDFTEQTDYASVLDANANGRVLNQDKDYTTLTVWENFTIQNGKLTTKAADNLGAGVAVRKQGRILNCLVQNNTYDYTEGNCMGGGLGHESGNRNDTCAVDCIFRNNVSTHGGGARVRGVVVGCTFEQNTSKNGGVLYLQEAKGYELASATQIISINALLGIIGTVFSGWLSDVVFRGNRYIPAVTAGVLEVIALVLFAFGGNALWVNILAMVLFGIAIGVLICFLGGLMAVDIVPREASGAALGVVGIASYAAAGLQDIASGLLIDGHKTLVSAAGEPEVFRYDFTYALWFWIIAAVLSVLLVTIVWHKARKKPRKDEVLR